MNKLGNYKNYQIYTVYKYICILDFSKKIYFILYKMKRLENIHIFLKK